MEKIKNSFLFKTYLKLPLWGKVLLPAAVILLGISLIKMLKTALYLGIFAIVVYGVLNAWVHFQGKNK